MDRMDINLANSTNRVNEFVPSPISDNSLLKWQFVSWSPEDEKYIHNLKNVS